MHYHLTTYNHNHVARSEVARFTLLLPDNDLPCGVCGGEEPLARAEGDGRDGARVAEQLVGDRVGRRTGEVEEEDGAVLGAGSNARPLAERQQWRHHG